MSLWPAFMLIAILLHLADRAFGFGYLLSALAVIIFGVSVASAVGYSIEVQEPYISIIGPLILAPVAIRAAYVAFSKSQGPATDLSQQPDNRYRNFRPALRLLSAGTHHLETFLFRMACAAMAALAAYIVFAEQTPPPESSSAFLIGGGIVSTHIAGKYTRSMPWRTLALGLGIFGGGLLFFAALYARLIWSGHVPPPL